MKASDTVKCIIGGDFSTFKTRDARPATEEFSRGVLAELMPYLDAADIRICNLENVLIDEADEAPIRKVGPSLRGAPEEVGFLRAGGFDCVTLANNHLGDHGEGAVMKTIALLDENGIAHIGGGANIEEAYRPWYAERNGLRIAFLTVCENEFGCAGETTAGSAGYRQKRLFDAIGREKSAADFVIVIFHGGQERNPVPSPSVIERYRLLIDVGADAVIAMHTHCIEGYEYYKDKPIVYSMGNLYFPVIGEWGVFTQGGERSPWFYGYLSELTVERGKPIKFRPIPYRMVDECSRIEVPVGERREAILAYIERLSAIIADPSEVSRLYDAWCTEAGMNYLRQSMTYSPSLEEPSPAPEVLTQITRYRGVMTCESHNAMLTRLSELLHLGKLDEAREALPELKELQKMPI